MKKLYLDNEWIDTAYGVAITRDSGTQLTIVGVDVASYFNVNRRIKVVGSGGTKYGFVESGTLTAGNTVVVVTIDTPDSIPTGPSAALLHHSSSLNRIAFGGTIPTGCVLPWSGAVATIPAGYLLCNGAEKNQVTFAALWTAFGGHLYGSPANPSVDFKLPTLGGKVIIGQGVDGDGDYGTVGGAYGSKTVASSRSSTTVTSTGESVTHAHQYQLGSFGLTGTFSNTVDHTHGVTTPVIGAGTAHENRQPSIVMAYIIKT